MKCISKGCKNDSIVDSIYNPLKLCADCKKKLSFCIGETKDIDGDEE